jgi:hypothetical protein
VTPSPALTTSPAAAVPSASASAAATYAYSTASGSSAVSNPTGTVVAAAGAAGGGLAGSSAVGVAVGAFCAGVGLTGVAWACLAAVRRRRAVKGLTRTQRPPPGHGKLGLAADASLAAAEDPAVVIAADGSSAGSSSSSKGARRAAAVQHMAFSQRDGSLEAPPLLAASKVIMATDGPGSATTTHGEYGLDGGARATTSGGRSAEHRVAMAPTLILQYK